MCLDCLLKNPNICLFLFHHSFSEETFLIQSHIINFDYYFFCSYRHQIQFKGTWGNYLSIRKKSAISWDCNILQKGYVRNFWLNSSDILKYFLLMTFLAYVVCNMCLWIFVFWHFFRRNWFCHWSKRGSESTGGQLVRWPIRTFRSVCVQY